MQCPNCNIEMQMFQREAVKLLYCEQCGSVWLDRGRVEGGVARTAEAARSLQRDERSNVRDDHDEDRDGASVRGGRRGRDNDDDSEERGGLRGFLGNLLNFD